MSFATETRRALTSPFHVAATGSLLIIGLAIGSGCTEASVYHSGAQGAKASSSASSSPGDTSMPTYGNEPVWEQSEAIEPGPMGDVFQFDDLDISAEPIELRPSTPFIQFETFLITDDPLFQYQVLNSAGHWGAWQTFVPDGSHSGTFAGIVTLESPATALRFITEEEIEYIYFEFFEQALELDGHDHDHDHDHAHDDDTLLQNDPEYLALADAGGVEEDDDLAVRSSDLSVRQQGLITSCNKRRMAAYSRGTRLPDIEVIQMDGKNVGLNTASAYEKMRIAAARSGVNLRIVSGLRTMDEQTYLYNCYRTKRCNNGNLAARPGYSNHQNGLALDLNTRDRGVLNWLNRNGANYGFRRTVRSEPWHWEYTAGVTVSPQVCSGQASSEPGTSDSGTNGSGTSDSGSTGSGTTTNSRTCSAESTCAAGMECVEGQCVNSGTLRFTLTWQDRTDIDLHVLTPTGEKLWYRNRNTADGGIFDSDSCIGTRCQTDSVLLENVFWSGEATEGNYTFWAVNYSGAQEVAFTVDVTINGERKTFQSTVPAERNAESYKFTISHPSGEVVEN